MQLTGGCGEVGREAAPAEVFALLDDSRAADTPTSRLYTDFAHESVCSDPGELDGFWHGVEADLARGLHAVFCIDYEWGVALQRGEKRHVGLVQDAASLEEPHRKTEGTFRVLLFRTLDFLSEPQVGVWLARAEAHALGANNIVVLNSVAVFPGPVSDGDIGLTTLPPPAPAGIADLRTSVDTAQFNDAIAQIHAALERGDCYQINYTFRLNFGIFGHPVSLYRRVRARQPAAYGALICSTHGWTLSASPELFVRHQSGRVLAQPMKGTAARDPDPIRDTACGAALQADPKNRAENVMIVDLLRNDLSKLSIPGGVRVEKLFAVQAWPTLWQMTSDVAATLKRDVTFPDVLRALFPCGSITGAPKHAAMALIQRLEDTSRGLYTGALGWFDSRARSEAEVSDADGAIEASSRHAHRCGDFCLSVTIRTITIEAAKHADKSAHDRDPSAVSRIQGLRMGRAGIGAGIVLDSDPVSEHAECLLKARFLTEADPGFALFETLLAVAKPLKGGKVGAAMSAHHLPLRERHLQRLSASASRLGFRFNAAAVDAALAQALASIRGSGAHRLRLVLNKKGDIDCRAWPLKPLKVDGAVDAPGAVSILLASDHGFRPVADASPADVFLLQFKTTHRSAYDRAWQQAEEKGAFDMIFTNAAGGVTEGGRSSLLVKVDGQWRTPPVEEGLLPGIMRSVLMDDPTWQLREQRLDVSDLLRAEAMAVCNALRGVMPAVLRRP